mmetsp:Transcript_43725/g.81577  ORF Transcript_43725/g.81577 Transcript_43725/m.81577 type:complete len:383 (+) Transcript_43725:42-1190(+)
MSGLEGEVSEEDPCFDWPLAAVGRACGLLDMALGFAAHLKPLAQHRFFTKGWGDLQILQDGRLFMDDFVADYQKGVSPPKVALGPERSVFQGSGVCCRGTFPSPLASYLPEESKLCEFELLQPKNRQPWACVIQFPGTADQSYLFRKLTVASPLLQQGVASVLITPAFYGNRRPKQQILHYIDKVSDFCLQSEAVLLEALQVLDWLKMKFPNACLGCTGISWGGAMASCMGFLAQRHDLAVLPCLPSANPEVLITGALRGEVALDCLAAGGLQVNEAESLLRGVLCAMSTETLQQMEIPGPVGHKVVLQVSAFYDTFVDKQASKLVFRSLRHLDSGAQLSWVASGHASSHAAGRFLFAAPVLSGLHRLSRQRQGSAPVLSKL